MQYGIVIQSRYSSSRLPGKALKLVNGEPMLLKQYKRLSIIKNIPIIIATSTHESDDKIYQLCINNKIKCFRGSLDNVVERFYECAMKYKLDYIIRVGGDDPLIDPECCLSLINTNKNNIYDFIYASSRKGWPYGCAAELISKNSLKNILDNTDSRFFLEHTIPYFFENSSMFKIKKLISPKNINRPNYYFSVDYQEDFDLIENIFEYFKEKENYFTMQEVIYYIDKNKELLEPNKSLHEGFDR